MDVDVITSNLEDVADALALPDNPLASPTKSIALQRERVEAAKRQVKSLSGGGLEEDVKASQVTTIHNKSSTAHAGHALVDNAKALKYPNANWEVRASECGQHPLLRNSKHQTYSSPNTTTSPFQARPANFHDYESLQSQYDTLKSSKKNLQANIKSLKARLADSNSALDTLTAKRRLLTNAKDMSDFKVDLGVGPEGRDGWLAVPEPPANDKLQSQVNALEMKLVNKQLASSMADLEAFSSECARKTAALESKLRAREAKLASFPKKAVQDISEVQRACIR